MGPQAVIVGHAVARSRFLPGRFFEVAFLLALQLCMKSWIMVCALDPWMHVTRFSVQRLITLHEVAAESCPIFHEYTAPKVARGVVPHSGIFSWNWGADLPQQGLQLSMSMLSCTMSMTVMNKASFLRTQESM